jgi:short-subunit dehydrogenase
MARYDGRTVLITGASSGIGAALARTCASAGANVVLVARRVERLQALADDIDPSGQRVMVAPADLTIDGEIESMVGAALERFGRIDVVMANAGVGIGGRFEQLSVDDFRRQLEVNVFGVLRTVGATRESLIETNGRLAIVGSVNGFLALPGTGPYSMSKFAIRGLADVLRAEFAGEGVSVTHVVPGFVDTEIRRVDNAGALRADWVDPAPRWIRIPVARAARAIARAVDRRARERILGGHGHAAVFLARHFPRTVAWVLARGARRSRADPKRGDGT